MSNGLWKGKEGSLLQVTQGNPSSFPVCSPFSHCIWIFPYWVSSLPKWLRSPLVSFLSLSPLMAYITPHFCLSRESYPSVNGKPQYKSSVEYPTQRGPSKTFTFLRSTWYICMHRTHHASYFIASTRLRAEMQNQALGVSPAHRCVLLTLEHSFLKIQN